jgi:transposase-like protein
MAGRGAIPVQLSPDYIAAIRHEYVDGDTPVREICKEFGISSGKLDRLMKQCGWPRRTDRPPRQLSPPLKLREQARMLAENSNACRAPLRAALRPGHMRMERRRVTRPRPPPRTPTPPRASRRWC